ncbi:nitroreductase [Pigmentiphaga aceris]|uniref:Nitroreductase n=1 Tax=Pigmentiphaga aceris TaxID=1940612 RepID=A0A5C0B058_9BURK|nr:nitroreductase [Pigmentiphaga aceris]QEI06500.1 nitroreductase [Pigmentiphaga aceris]
MPNFRPCLPLDVLSLSPLEIEAYVPGDPDGLYAGDLASLRKSTRAFLDAPLPDGTVPHLLTTARRAPSGANLQPGKFIAVEGDARARLSAALVEAWRAGQAEPEDYDYFPRPMPMHLKRRQLAAAQALYGALGVERHDRAGRDKQFERNFNFFDAPVALIVTIDRDFGAGGYMDLGMTLYGLMLAAHREGLGCCAIGALASYPGLIRQTLGLDERSSIVCGVALGYADPAAPVNQTTTTRCELDDYFTTIR